MEDNCIQNINNTIDTLYHRNRSLIDTISKCGTASQNAFRKITKAATHCGCINFYAKKQPSGLSESVPSLIDGKLCDGCKSEIEQEVAKLFFYSFGLCKLLDLDAEKIINDECSRVKTLGKFNLR